MSFIEEIISKNRSLFMSRTRTESSQRFDMAVRVFYRLLETIFRNEERRKNCNVEGLFHHERVINSLCACSVEIVFCAYGNAERFPWIIDCFKMSAFVFYRIIEPVVAAHGELLSRNIIDHLKRIEEQCLESLVWTADSPIWQNLEKYTIPKWTECNTVNVNSATDSNTISGVTPHNAALPQCELLSPQHYPKVVQSNVASSGSVRQLFKGFDSKEAIVFDNLSNFVELANLPGNNGSVSSSMDSTPIKRNNYLALFFRKFYVLAYKRIETLFMDLDFSEPRQLSEIWTIFEHCVVNQSQLFRDRHMDQIIMCSVYVYAKVKEIKKDFREIMQKYRNQMHASSHVYRNVYIGPVTDDGTGEWLSYFYIPSEMVRSSR